MIKIARLSIGYAHHKNGNDMKAVLDEALAATGTSLNDISVNGGSYSTKTHFGNWVLTPVLDNDASRRLADYMGTRLDNRRSILEQPDIYKFKIGQKVMVQFISDLGFNVKSEGKVHNIHHTGAISILQKGKRTGGWTFRPGQEVAFRQFSRRERRKGDS